MNNISINFNLVKDLEKIYGKEALINLDIDRILDLTQERCRKLSDISKYFIFFFIEKYELDTVLVNKRLKIPNMESYLKYILKEYNELIEFNSITTHDKLQEIAKHFNVPFATLVHSLRISITGIGEGPSLFEILEILGKYRVCKRLITIITKLENNLL